MADTPLTDLQRAVLEMFFSLPEAEGFVLAGGAGLVAAGLSTRPTQDLDLFGVDEVVGVGPAADALESACRTRGWSIERIRDSATFRRLIIRRNDEELLVDLAIDSPPLTAPTTTALGPTYPTEELARRRSWLHARSWRSSTAPRPETSLICTRCRSTSNWIASRNSLTSLMAASPASFWPSPSRPTSALPMTNSPPTEQIPGNFVTSLTAGVPACLTEAGHRVVTVQAATEDAASVETHRASTG
jgi:hypothetical protein